MKRILVGLTLAASATLLTAAPAQAAPADPVKALAKQYVPNHGVRFSETARTRVDGKAGYSSSMTGAFEFGKKGVIAADHKTKGGPAGFGDTRLVTVGKHTYAQGGLFSEDLPEGKKWVRYPVTGNPRLTNQPLDIFEPKALRTLVSKAKSFKGGTYRGSTTFGAISKIYGQKVDKRLGKIKIAYALGVNSKGLVTQLRSEYTLDFGIIGKTTATVSTHYTGWGAKITIKAPPADQVIDFSELGEDTSLPQEIPNGSLNSFAGTE